MTITIRPIKKLDNQAIQQIIKDILEESTLNPPNRRKIRLKEILEEYEN